MSKAIGLREMTLSDEAVRQLKELAARPRPQMDLTGTPLIDIEEWRRRRRILQLVKEFSENTTDDYK